MDASANPDGSAPLRPSTFSTAPILPHFRAPVSQSRKRGERARGGDSILRLYPERRCKQDKKSMTNTMKQKGE
jgi:hypothetical protein